MTREPITLRGLVSVVVTAVAELVAALGFDVPADLQAAVIGVVLAAGLVWTVVDGRRHVTVLSDPKDVGGAKLMREDGETLLRQRY